MEQQKKTIIRNVGMLDMTKATEESTSRIHSIGNVGVVLATTDTAHLLGQISVSNIGSMVTIPAGVKHRVSNGMLRISGADQAPDEKIYLLANGKLVIDETVTAEQLKTFYEGIMINGKALCPKALAGALDGLVQVNGVMVYYPDGYVLIEGRTKLDAQFAAAAPEGARYFIEGAVVALDSAALRALADKQVLIGCDDEMIIYEGDREIAARLAGDNVTKYQIVPDGYAYHAGDLDLDRIGLRIHKGLLYVDGNLAIDKQVTPEQLGALTGLAVRRTLNIPETLLDAVLNMNARYAELEVDTGTRLVINGDFPVSAESLEAIEEPVNLIVNGDLLIAKDVSPRQLEEKLSIININGDVKCAPSLNLALLKLGKVNGDILDIDAPEPKEYQDNQSMYNVISNAGSYAL